jgi:hypothetical protein
VWHIEADICLKRLAVSGRKGFTGTFGTRKVAKIKRNTVLYPKPPLWHNELLVNR